MHTSGDFDSHVMVRISFLNLYSNNPRNYYSEPLSRKQLVLGYGYRLTLAASLDQSTLN